MNARRMSVILGSEIRHGSKGFIIVALAVPLFMSVLVSLIFGSLFSGRPKLGVLQTDGSSFLAEVRTLDAVRVREYASRDELVASVERGAVDMAIVAPDSLDADLEAGKQVVLTAYTWGESLAKDRVIVYSALSKLVRSASDQEKQLNVITEVVGEELSMPWSDRLLPFLVLITVFLGGIFLPATSLIAEKEHGTLNALLVTPITAEEVFTAKGILSFVLSAAMGTMILVINGAFGLEPGLLMLLVLLGSLMAVTVGLLVGAALKDVTTLFALWKGAGIVLFGPAVVYMFPKIPQWIGRIFPTYYLIQPIVAISQQGKGWEAISTNVLILIAIDAALIVVLGLVLRMSRRRQMLG